MTLAANATQTAGSASPAPALHRADAKSAGDGQQTFASMLNMATVQPQPMTRSIEFGSALGADGCSSPSPVDNSVSGAPASTPDQVSSPEDVLSGVDGAAVVDADAVTPAANGTAGAEQNAECGTSDLSKQAPVDLKASAAVADAHDEVGPRPHHAVRRHAAVDADAPVPTSASTPAFPLPDAVVPVVLPHPSLARRADPAAEGTKQEGQVVSAQNVAPQMPMRLLSAKMTAAGRESNADREATDAGVDVDAVAAVGATSSKFLSNAVRDVPRSDDDVNFAYSFAAANGASHAPHYRVDTTDVKQPAPVREMQEVVAKAAMPLRSLDVSVHDPVFGSLEVRAEMRAGLLHASIKGRSGVEHTLPELQQFLQRHDVALHTLTVSPREPVARIDEAQSGAMWQGQHDGRDSQGAREQRSQDAWKRSARRGAEEDTGADLPPRNVMPVVPHVRAGSTLSIHI